MDFHNNAWDWQVLGLSSPSLSEDVIDFSSSSVQSSFTEIEQLNTSHEKSDLFAEWMDEKIDLSILDGLEGQPGILDDLDVMDGDPVALLENLMDWSSLLGSDDINTKKGESLEQNMLQTPGFSPPVSPGGGVPDISLAVLPELKQESFYRQTSDVSRSPVTTVTFVPGTELKSIDDFNPLDYLKVEYDGVAELECHMPSNPPLTPVSFLSSDNEHLKVEACSPVNTELESSLSYTPPVSPKSFVPTVESVETKNMNVEMSHSCSSFVLDSPFSCKNSDNESHEIPDVSMKEYNSGNTSLLELKADAKSHFQTKKHRSRKMIVSSSDSPMPVEVRRKERKRVQNKDAATRYREKKRKESRAVVGEELTLEKRNKELHNTVDKLSNEISYLKELLKEAKLRAQSRQKMSSNVNSSITV